MNGATRHNALIADIQSEATRLGTTVTLSGPYLPGGAAHVNAHKEACIALIELRDYANNVLGVTPAVTITLPPERFVGDSDHVDDHALIDSALAVIQAITI